jgi:hypothetical protein
MSWLAALAIAAALITRQRLSYEGYLHLLRSLPVPSHLSGDQHQGGLTEAVQLSLRAVQIDDLGNLCTSLMETSALLSAAGVSRDLLHAIAEAGTTTAGMPADVVDSALERLADRSLLSFSIDGQVVLEHPLVMRVVRETSSSAGG